MKLRTTLSRTGALYEIYDQFGDELHVEAEPISDVVPAIFSATCANCSGFRGEPLRDRKETTAGLSRCHMAPGRATFEPLNVSFATASLKGGV
jgi:hypothetical protein